MARNETKDTIVIALCATAVISMTIGPLVYVLVGESKYSNQEKVLCEQIKEDTNLHSFKLDNYVLENLDENYFLTLNGSALKTPDHPLEFVSVKYSISEKNYYNIRSDSETKNGMPNPDFLKNVLNTVCEGELVSIQTIEKNPTAIYNANEEEMIMLKSITNPTVHEDKGVATYEVEMFKFDTSNTDNPKMELIKKQVVVKLTDEIKNNPHSAYNVDKKDCKVKTLTKKVDVIKNSKIVSLNPNNR